MSVKRNVTVPDGRSVPAEASGIILAMFRFNLVHDSSVQLSSNLLARSLGWLDLIVFTPVVGFPFSTGTVLERTMSRRVLPPRTDSRFRAKGFSARYWVTSR